jgi:hypothetical protein
MTDTNPFDRQALTTDQFQTLLGQLLAAAWANDIDPTGTQAYRNGPDQPDWEIEIVELEKTDSS